MATVEEIKKLSQKIKKKKVYIRVVFYYEPLERFMKRTESCNKF